MSQRSTRKGHFWSNNPFYQWYISAHNGEHTCSAPSMESSTAEASECGSAGCGRSNGPGSIQLWCGKVALCLEQLPPAVQHRTWSKCPSRLTLTLLAYSTSPPSSSDIHVVLPDNSKVSLAKIWAFLHGNVNRRLTEKWHFWEYSRKQPFKYYTIL